MFKTVRNETTEIVGDIFIGWYQGLQELWAYTRTSEKCIEVDKLNSVLDKQFVFVPEVAVRVWRV